MIKPDVVNRVLGPQIYENYMSVLKAFIEEQTRAYANEKRFAFPWAVGLKARLEADLAFAEAVESDYRSFLEDVSSTGAGDVRTGEKIINVFTLAISVLMLINDALDDIFDLGLVAIFVALAAAGLDREARALETELKRLIERLKKAKREVVEAYAQTVFDLAIAGAMACLGPVGWLTIGVVGIVQIAADSYLGPSTSNAATWGSRGNTGVGNALSASEKYIQSSSKAMKVVKPAGRAVIVVGFLFDVNEIRVGYANVDDLETLMQQVRMAQDKLLDKVQHTKSLFNSLSAKLEYLRTDIEKNENGWILQTRQTLEDEMKRSGYRPRIGP